MKLLEKKLNYSNEELKIAISNLEDDGVEIGDIRTKNGDTHFKVVSKNLITRFGANDLDFWLEGQALKK